MTGIGQMVATELRAKRHGERSPASIFFLVSLWGAMAFAVICLMVLLVDSFLDGSTRLDAELFTRYTSQVLPERAGARESILAGASRPPRIRRTHRSSTPECVDCNRRRAEDCPPYTREASWTAPALWRF